MPDKHQAPVSVIIPCFRCAATIERAVSSVLQQHLRPVEIILVDDGSDDQTWSVLEKLRESYSSLIRLVQLKYNRGAARARNVGMKMATQPYLAFLDADDAWHQEKIKLQYCFMEENPNIFLSGHAYRQLGSSASIPAWEITECVAMPIPASRLILSNKFITPSVMMRNVGDYFFVEEQRHSEDYMMWLHIAFSGKRVSMLSAELAAIYKEPFGESGLSSQIWLMERAELGNYWRLYKEKFIGPIVLGLLTVYSLGKFGRRLVLFWRGRQKRRMHRAK